MIEVAGLKDGDPAQHKIAKKTSAWKAKHLDTKTPQRGKPSTLPPRQFLVLPQCPSAWLLRMIGFAALKDGDPTQHKIAKKTFTWKAKHPATKTIPCAPAMSQCLTCAHVKRCVRASLLAFFRVHFTHWIDWQ